MLAVFRGSVSPVMIVLSVAVGFWFGLMPGWSGFHTMIVIAMLILNVHLGLFLLSAGIGKALCFAAAPVLYYIGLGVQDHLSILLRLLASIPILGMTDFGRYSVAGAIVAGPIVGVIAGLLMARSVIGFRRTLLKLEDGSEKFKKWYSKRWVRIMDRLLIGKRTKDAKSLFTSKAKIIRKAGIVFAALVAAVLVFGGNLVKDSTIKKYAAKALTRANGAEADVNELDLSVLTGAIVVSGIQVTDAANPQNNQVSIGKVAADASLYNLLLGKVVMENVEVSDVRFDQKRATPGKVVEAEEKTPVFDPCDFKVEVSDIAKLETYFKKAKALREWFGKVSKWLPKSEDDDTEAAADAEQIPHKYLEYLEARAETLASPRVLARQILLDKVAVPSLVFGNSRIRMKNVSDAPQAVGLPVTFEMKSNDTPAVLNATLDYSSRDQTPLISGAFDGLDLSKVQSSLGENAGLVFSKGIASGKFNGKVTSEIIDLTVDVSIRDLQAKGRGKGVLGLGSKTTSDALGALSELNTTIRIVGPTVAPRLVFDVKGLTKAFKEALIKAGKERLADEIDKQIEEHIGGKLGDKAPSEIKDMIKKPKDLLKGLGGLLGGKEKE